MEKLRTNIRSGGKIKYEKSNGDDLFKKNVLEEDDSCSILKSWSTKTSRPHTSKSQRVSSSKSSFSNLRNIENWVNRKSVGQIQRHHSAESHGTRQMYEAVLNNEENFVRGIDNFLRENQLLQERKRELLHKDWARQVYTPSRKKIEQTIEDGYHLVDQIKRREYEKYLNYCNKKGNIFLDVKSHEYDAFAMLNPKNPANLTAHIPRLQDPLLSQERNHISDIRTVLYCKTGKLLSKNSITRLCLPKHPLKPLGRQDTSGQSFITMPHKYIASSSGLQMRRNPNKGTFDFGSWAEGGEDNSQIVRQEMKIQTRKRFPGSELSPSSLDVGKESLLNSEKKQHVRFALPETSDLAQPVEG